MFRMLAYDLPTDPSVDDCFLNIVLDALEFKDCVPLDTPDVGLGDDFVRENLKHFTLEKKPDGWVANLIFTPWADQPMGCMTTPVPQPLPTAREAFLHGASVVCAVVTGSDELPFFAFGNTLMMAGYGTCSSDVL